MSFVQPERQNDSFGTSPERRERKNSDPMKGDSLTPADYCYDPPTNESGKDGPMPVPADCVKVVLFLISCMFVMSFALNFVHAWMPDPSFFPPLGDIGFDYFQPTTLAWVTDVILWVMNAINASTCLLQKDWGTSMRMWVRYWQAYGFCNLLRTASMLCTSLPPTNNHCQQPPVIHDILYNTFIGVATMGGKNIHCGDLLFSGHTVCITVAALSAITHSRNLSFGWIIRAIAWPLLPVSWYTIISSRSHYTIDVAVGLYVGITVYSLVPNYVVAPLRVAFNPLRYLFRTPHSMNPKKNSFIRETSSQLV